MTGADAISSGFSTQWAAFVTGLRIVTGPGRSAISAGPRP